MKVRRFTTATTLFSAILLSGGAQASLLNLSGLYNTGVDGTGVPLATGTTDPHYTYLSAPASAPPSPVMLDHTAFPVPPWLALNATSGWIAPNTGASGPAGSASYTYRTSFSLPAGADPSKVQVQGVWAADDPGGASISINGNPTGIAPPAGFGGFSPTWTISSGFAAGLNNLDFTVTDAGGCCTGLRVEIQNFGYDIGLYNTGVDSSRVALGDDAADSHWMITSGPTLGGPLAATGAGGFPIGPWLGDDPASAWISPTADTVGGGGNYAYRTSFDLSTVDPSTFSISGRMAIDNSVTDILLNGVSTGITAGGFAAWNSFSLNSASGSGFVTGTNTLEFLVNNADAVSGPTGLRVEFLDVNGTIIPEPSGAILMALGGTLLLRRRRR